MFTVVQKSYRVVPMGLVGWSLFQSAEMEESNVIFNLEPTQTPSSVFFALKQIRKQEAKSDSQVKMSKQNRKFLSFRGNQNQNPIRHQKQNWIWLMQQNISDSFADWTEERWKRGARRGDRRESRVCIFLYPSWPLARMLSRRTWTVATERCCFTATLSLVRSLHYCLYFEGETDLFHYSVINNPTANMAIYSCCVCY